MTCRAGQVVRKGLGRPLLTQDAELSVAGKELVVRLRSQSGVLFLVVGIAPVVAIGPGPQRCLRGQR